MPPSRARAARASHELTQALGRPRGAPRALVLRQPAPRVQRRRADVRAGVGVGERAGDGEGGEESGAGSGGRARRRSGSEPAAGDVARVQEPQLALPHRADQRQRHLLAERQGDPDRADGAIERGELLAGRRLAQAIFDP
jgi:hypothetical protein